ncbi:MAG: putative transposase [Cellvibrionaceae bacterium]|jgi:putative transposase
MVLFFIWLDISLPAARVTRVLEQLKKECGLPKQLLINNRPELISALLIDQCEEEKIEMAYT